MKNIALILFVVTITIMGVNQANAQSRAEIRKHEREVQAAQLKNDVASMLQDQRYTFVATKALTSLKSRPSVDLTSGYDLTITPDTLKCHLPFYGYSTSATIGSDDSPLSFESTDFTYDKREKKRGDNVSTLVKIKAKYRSNTYQITINIQDNGSAVLNIQNNNLSNSTFWGGVK